MAAHLAYCEATMPDENHAYATPAAKNVRGKCTFGDRARGGSRPGLRALSGSVIVADSGKWLWPNGEAMLWPTGDTISFSTASEEITAPDGSTIIDPHEPFVVHCTKGNAPSAPTLTAVYRDRLFLADGANWFCSRIGDHGDFDYGDDSGDISRAFAGNCANAGRKGETIKAFMPVGDSIMYIATARALYCFRGDPSDGIRRLSEFIGCISANAWCSTPQGVVFVSLDGVYLATTDGGVRHISARLPEAFSGWASALLGYDPAAGGVHIFGTKGTGIAAKAQDWFLDIESGAFWPVSLPSTMRPTAVCRILSAGTETAALLGADGAWRIFHDEQTTDGGVDISSELVIGPFRVSSNDALDGILDEVRVSLGAGSGDVTIGVATAKTAEAAAKATRVAVSEYKAGYNNTHRVRRRGAWACLKLASTSRWAYESILVTLKHLGRLR